MIKRFWVGCLLGLVLVGGATAKVPSVVVTTKPLYSLILHLLDKTESRLVLLVDGATSAHDYRLKPAQVAELYSADLVVGVSAQYETFLSGFLPRLAENKVWWALSATSALPYRHRLLWLDDEDDSHAHAHAHGSKDVHFWLSSSHTVDVVRALSVKLQTLYPNQSGLIQGNSERLVERIQLHSLEIKEKLQGAQTEALLVYHDAFQYFEVAYPLKVLAAVATEPSAPVSMRHALRLREMVAKYSVRCVFSEPGIGVDKVRKLFAPAVLNVVALDPEALLLPASKDLYFRLLDELAQGVLSCLNYE